MIEISTDLKIRNFQWDDMRAVVDLMNISFDADGEEERAVYEITEHEWRSPESNPEKECSVVFDADNTTKALPLYERVGMHVHRHGDVLRKALRGRLEDVKDF